MPHIDDLRNDARHARDRLALYRAKVGGPRPTSIDRLRELERNAERTEARLANALAQDALSQKSE
jgi:hypothetical protein